MFTTGQNFVENSTPSSLPGSFYVQSLRKQSTMNQDDSVTMGMPVKAHIKKYLDKQVEGPLPVSLATTIGIFLYNVLRRQQQNSKYDKVVVQYPCTFPVAVSRKNLFDYGARNFTSYTAVQFNRVFDNELRYECLMHVNYSVRYRSMETKQAVEEFLDIYDFDDTELTYQTLIRHIHRIKASDKKKTSPLLWPGN